MDKSVMMYKESLLSSGLFRRVSSTQYRVQECPKCGDRKWHCYVKIDLDSDCPVVFNCFKCNSSGIVDKSFLEYIGMSDISIPKFKYGKKINVSETVSTKIDLNSITVDESDDITGICNYVNDRVGHYPTLSELQSFGYVGNPYKYTRDFLGVEGQASLKNRFWFRLTNGNISGRWYDDNIDMRWLRYKSNRVKTSGLYKINVPVDLYQPIDIIIAEGVMDVIGLYYNYTGAKNCVYIAVMGKDYNRAIKYIIDRGIFGTCVSVKIFKDVDVNVNDIRIDYNTKKLFKRVDIYGNILDKDYGVLPDRLEINKIN